MSDLLVRKAKREAARKMLKALKELREWEAQQGLYDAPCWDMMHNAIKLAEEAGITTGERE